MESRILWETEFNHLSWDKLLVQKKINGIHKVYQIIEFRKMFAGNLSVFFRLKKPYLSSLSRKIWSFRSLGETSKHGILRDCTYDCLYTLLWPAQVTVYIQFNVYKVTHTYFETRLKSF